MAKNDVKNILGIILRIIYNEKDKGELLEYHKLKVSTGK